MSDEEIPREELIRAMVEVGTLLTGPKPIEERMAGLCAASAFALRCDYIVVQMIDGDHYRGEYQFGLPPELEGFFANYTVSRSKPIIAKIEACDSYLLFNGAVEDDAMANIAKLTGVESVVIVPFTYPDGEPLGYLVAAYTTEKVTVAASEVELAMGMARITQTTMLRYLETQKRREVSQAMLQVADSERRRLSRDIHDDPLQRILAVRIGLEAFGSQLSNEADQREVDRLVQECREASSSLREVMLRTHPTASEMADLEATLRSLVDRRNSGQKLKLEFSDQRSTGSPSYLVPAINRIAEQAARNTLLHAQASNLVVELCDKDTGTHLTVRDNGRGFDPNTVDQRRLGVVSMRERTELLGGHFSIESSPGNGTTVTAWFPHADTNSDEAS